MNSEQQLALEAAKEVKRICDEYCIKYYFLAGSTLGAIRHKGFIPWDDDIDIGIPYEDIRRFEKAVDSIGEKYKYVSHHVNNKYPKFNGKILYHGKGCVDIFPLVKMSDNAFVSAFQWYSHKLLLHLLFRKHQYSPDGENRFLYILSTIIAPIFSRNMIISLDDMVLSLCSSKKTKNRCNITSKYSYHKEIIISEWIEKSIIVEFEGVSFRSIGCVDDYLTHLYGNYMQLPPEDQRKPEHAEVFKL